MRADGGKVDAPLLVPLVELLAVWKGTAGERPDPSLPGTGPLAPSQGPPALAIVTIIIIHSNFVVAIIIIFFFL